MLSYLFSEAQHEMFLSAKWPLDPLFGKVGRVPQSLLNEWAAELEPMQLIPRVSGDVQVWSSSGSKTCPGSESLSLYAQGCSLYLSHVERLVPCLVERIRALEEELGVPTGSGHCSIFVGKRGATVPAHCDHDFGFNLLLIGRKFWKISAYSRRYFPLRGHQVGRGGNDERWGRGEPLPQSMPIDADPFEQTPGCCVFLPPGIWHQTDLSEDCISLDFAIDPPRRSDVIADTLRSMLNEDERFRTPFDKAALTWWQLRGLALVGRLANLVADHEVLSLSKENLSKHRK